MPSVNLSQETYEKLKALAALKGRSLDDVAEKALRDHVADESRTAAAWREEWNRLLSEIRAAVPAHLTAEEIEADIDATVAKVRAERRARGH